jgi:hypothetical protein
VNVCIALRPFGTLLVTVPEAEKAFRIRGQNVGGSCTQIFCLQADPLPPSPTRLVSNYIFKFYYYSKQYSELYNVLIIIIVSSTALRGP